MTRRCAARPQACRRSRAESPYATRLPDLLSTQTRASGGRGLDRAAARAATGQGQFAAAKSGWPAARTVCLGLLVQATAPSSARRAPFDALKLLIDNNLFGRAFPGQLRSARPWRGSSRLASQARLEQPGLPAGPLAQLLVEEPRTLHRFCSGPRRASLLLGRRRRRFEAFALLRGDQQRSRHAVMPR